MSGRAGIGEFLYRLRKGVYVGARGQYRNATLSLNLDRPESSDITFQPPDQVANVIDEIRNQLLHFIRRRFLWGHAFSGTPGTACTIRNAAS